MTPVAAKYELESKGGNLICEDLIGLSLTQAFLGAQNCQKPKYFDL